MLCGCTRQFAKLWGRAARVNVWSVRPTQTSMRSRALTFSLAVVAASCAVQSASTHPASAWYQVTSATQVLAERGVFPLTVEDLTKVFSPAEIARLRAAPQAQGAGRVHTDLTWTDVDGRCSAYFQTDNSERNVEDISFTCSASSEAEALTNLRAWLDPFHVQVPEGKSEAEGSFESAAVSGGVYAGDHGEPLTKLRLRRRGAV